MDYKIGDRIKDDKRDLTITDMKYFTQANRRSWYYKYHCNVCGFNCDGGYTKGEYRNSPWYSKQDLQTKGCPCCSSKIVVPDINSISVTHPELSKYFLNDDDKKYTILSNQKVKMKCPFCGTIKENMVISSLYRQGFA